MFQHLESHAHNLHENTNVLVDNLIEFILKSYYDFERAAAKFSSYLLDKNQPSAKNNVEIQINGQQVYSKQADREPTVTLTPQQLEQLSSALEKPELVEGSVRILIDELPVLHIENGQILQDDLELLKTQSQSLDLNTSSQIAQEQAPDLITQAGNVLIAEHGRQLSEKISAFHGHSYSYEQNDGSFSIHAYGRGAVFKDGAFTALATQDDQQTLSQLPQRVKQELGQLQQQANQRSPALKV